MTLADIDKALAQWESRLGSAASNLFDLQNDPTYQCLTGTSDAPQIQLTGITAARISPALDNVGTLFQCFDLLRCTINQAIEVRRELPAMFGGEQKEREIHRLLFGKSVRVPTEQIPIASRSLLSGADQGCISADELLKSMVKAFETARDGVMAVDAAWRDLGGTVGDAARQIAALRTGPQRLEDAEIRELEGVEHALALRRAQVQSDPLGTTLDLASAVLPSLARLKCAVEERVEIRRQTEDGLVAGRARLEGLRSLHRDASEAWSEAQRKITGAGALPVPLSEGRIGSLQEWLNTLQKKYDEGMLRPVTVGLQNWNHAARDLEAEVHKIHAANCSPLEQRKELRGRLNALKAKAQAYRVSEDRELMALANEAEGLLYTRPTPIDRADEVVARYQAMLSQRTVAGIRGEGSQMNGDRCRQSGCTGTIQDGYCEICGHAEPKGTAVTAAGSVAAPAPPKPSAKSAVSTPVSSRTSSQITTGTGSSPMSRAGKGTLRTSHSSSRTSRKQLGAGLITLPDLPSTDPEKAIMFEPKVPERKRFCPTCNSALKRETGFCGKCGQKYSFLPTLNPGDVVAGQYEVKGALAYGGLGWIYLGFDKVLSRYVVLKGLLNTNDESSAAVAVAERQFLAAVKHPNIVGIHNFVQRGSEGFIVMEYVGGKTLKQIRQERGPMPVAEAIAYIHRILPAFTYLHNMGLVYCDFKPDNVMLERDDVKLIDMGGVRRIDDEKGDIYGTVGYTAPEAGEGPTPVSDVFTVGRTLAVLLSEIKSFSNEHRYSLPSPQEEPLFAAHESLYRCLLKATAEKADDRFESAEDMTEQLLGVLREVVAVETGNIRPAASLYFGGDILALESGDEMEPVRPHYHYLPMTSLDTSDPGFQRVNNANMLSDPKKRATALQEASKQVPKSREARLRLADALAETAKFPAAEKLLKALADEDPWDWRVLWFLGRIKLAANDAKAAQQQFDQVYFDMPGELAPKLALGLAAEMAGNVDIAIKMYDLVSRTDPGFISAAFGLSRCLLAKGDRAGAVKALDRVPASASLYLKSRINAARALICTDHAPPGSTELSQASALVESLPLDPMHKHQLGSQILTSALVLLNAKKLQPDKAVKIFGEPLQENRLRISLEKSYRSMAQLLAGEERINMVDRANEVRPHTLI